MSRVALPALPLVACVLLAAPAPAYAQSRWHEQVNAQIERAAKFLNERAITAPTTCTPAPSRTRSPTTSP
jgi:hypothetical protein